MSSRWGSSRPGSWWSHRWSTPTTIWGTCSVPSGARLLHHCWAPWTLGKRRCTLTDSSSADLLTDFACCAASQLVGGILYRGAGKAEKHSAYFWLCNPMAHGYVVSRRSSRYSSVLQSSTIISLEPLELLLVCSGTGGLALARAVGAACGRTQCFPSRRLPPAWWTSSSLTCT